MFIGEKEIESILPDGEKDLKVDFIDKSSCTINKELFDIIKSEEAGIGQVTDQVRDYFARKFVAELAYYGMTYSSIAMVGAGMDNVIWNLREDAIKKAFGCQGSTEIKLMSLFDKDVIIEKPKE